MISNRANLMKRLIIILLAGITVLACNASSLVDFSQDSPVDEQPPPELQGQSAPPPNSEADEGQQAPDNLRSDGAPILAGCPVFPADNVWNIPVDSLPVHPNSDVYVAAIGLDDNLHPDFGSGVYEGQPIGIPYDIVSSGQAAVSIDFDYADESDNGPYLIPDDAQIEGGSESDGDRHVIVLEQDTCTLYELFYAFPQADGSWTAGSGAIFDLNANSLRPDTWTSADAAGLPILPGLVRYEEVAAGEIQHALRFTASQTQRAFIWPARHFASDITDSNFPPMGLRMRLQADFDISGFSPDVQVILQALKTYGMILADNGSPWFISGAPDERWDNEILNQIKEVPGSAFEAVDTSAMIVDPNSGQVKNAFVPIVEEEVPANTSTGSGLITYTLEDGTVYRIAAEEGSQPENISQALDLLGPGSGDGLLNISPDGQWLVLQTERFDPECNGWPCLAIVAGDLSSAEAIRAGGEIVHPEDFSAVASGGQTIAYPTQGGPNTQDLWAVDRSGGSWGTPLLLTADSPFDYNYMPAFSDDGTRLVFDCGDIPYGVEQTAICEVNADGSNFRIVIAPGNGFTNFNQPDYAPDGSIVFEASAQGEFIWRLSPDSDQPVQIAPQFFNDNTSCVLADGRVASLWLDREGGPGAHELKVMSPDGHDFFMAVSGFDVFDVGIGCGG